MAYTTVDNPELYFQTKTYTGTGSSHAITLDGSENMQPDWVWIKQRGGTTWHNLYDSVRGVTKTIISNENQAEETRSSGLTAFGTDGFTVGSDNNANGSSNTYVAWNWKAGTSFSNSAGANSATIASTGSVNTDAGFSIISYTGNGNDDDTAKIAHGLGVALNMIIVKCRNAAGGWQTSSTSLGFNNVLQLNESNAQASGTYAFGRTGVAPTSTVFTVSATSGGNHTNTNNNTYIAYCFAEKKGYSKFGSYTGNGNADGTFIYTGFKPAWIVLKNVSNAQNWYMYDNKRSDFNLSNDHIYADLNNAETADSSHGIDILSNGFKIRTSNDGWNGSGENYIYMAFAESPFVNSKGVPNNAR